MTTLGIGLGFAVVVLSACGTSSESGTPVDRRTLFEERAPSGDCVTGTHWVGGTTGHEEMYPGRDCLGCHRQNGGPPLAVGGTIYAVSRQVDDCYGEPGVTVLVKDANNELFQLETNAAGNFFLRGDESLVAKPYRVKIRWPALASTAALAPEAAPATASKLGAGAMAIWDTTPPGVEEMQMLPGAMTGDCGFCHRAMPNSSNKMPNTAAGQDVDYFVAEWTRSAKELPLSDFPDIDFD